MQTRYLCRRYVIECHPKRSYGTFSEEAFTISGVECTNSFDLSIDILAGDATLVVALPIKTGLYILDGLTTQVTATVSGDNVDLSAVTLAPDLTEDPNKV